MILSDVSIKRPVLALVMNLLLVAFGLVAYQRLQFREYPDIDPPIVSVETRYPGASAAVVENRITQLIEDRISGVESIRTISSSSRDGVSTISVEFYVGRDIDAAANDLREAISQLLNELPDEADPPEISKQDAASEVLMWLNLTGEDMTPLELADYADRYLVDRFAVLAGVARVRVGGASRYAMRIWIDPEALAARGLTVTDIEDALRRENVELPAGALQSADREFTVRLAREFISEDAFRLLVVARGEDGYQVKLGEVAEVQLGAEQPRLLFRGNGVAMVGVGIIKQAQANTLAVANAVKAEAEAVRAGLPSGMKLEQSYDTSMFIEASIQEVFRTLALAVVLVVLVIYLFLGSVRAMLVPAVTVPISLISTFILLNAFGFSVNVLTLLALVLAIGLVVDDAIVVLENIFRRIELGESPLVAAYRGTRQVGFAVIATTVVLVAVFLPISFLQGDIGKLFTEFAVTLAIAVSFSSFVALTLSAMLGSRLLPSGGQRANTLTRVVEHIFRWFQAGYRRALAGLIHFPAFAAVLFGGAMVLTAALYRNIPSEFTPYEDRGAFFAVTTAPEGTSYAYSREVAYEIERRMRYLIDGGEAKRVLIRAPRGFGAALDYNQVITIVVLEDWADRRPAQVIMDEVRTKLATIPGVKTFTVMRQGLTRGLQKPVQIVLGGPTYETLAEWRDILVQEAANNPNLVGLDYDYKETKPQISLRIDRARAADLGVSIAAIGRTLESLLGSRRVTTFLLDGEEYDVLIEGDWDDKRTPSDVGNLYVRSDRSGQLIPLGGLLRSEEFADSGTLNRYNRIRSITIEANLAPGYSLSTALDYFENLAATLLPETAVLNYKGDSLSLRETTGSANFVFALALLVVFLVLSAQFESFVQAMVIMLCVPAAIAGALFGLYVSGLATSIYSQIGMIMLIGLAAKNGILIVEFINQLRDQGMSFEQATVEASVLRFRPIIMTGLTTIMGSVPLLLSHGAGAETRYVVGVVILSGVAVAMVFTLFLVPVAYYALARRTTSPEANTHRLLRELEAHPEAQT